MAGLRVKGLFEQCRGFEADQMAQDFEGIS